MIHSTAGSQIGQSEHRVNETQFTEEDRMIKRSTTEVLNDDRRRSERVIDSKILPSDVISSEGGN